MVTFNALISCCEKARSWQKAGQQQIYKRVVEVSKGIKIGEFLLAINWKGLKTKYS